MWVWVWVWVSLSLYLSLSLSLSLARSLARSLSFSLSLALAHVLFFQITCADLVEELLRQAKDPLSTLYKHPVTRNCFRCALHIECVLLRQTPCLRLESLDAHGLELADKVHEAALVEHAAQAEAALARGEAPVAKPVHQGAKEVDVVVAKEKDAMARYREWSDKHIHSLKGITT